jgi:hypothetical protein
MKKDTNDIAGLIKGLERPSLSVEKKLEMKARVMSHVKSHQKQEWRLTDFVSRSVTDVVLTPYAKTMMKERILSYIETAKQQRFSFGSALSLSKRLAGAFLAFLMVFSTFSFVGVNVNVASADSFTVIESLRGEVVIERAGDRYFAADEMELEEGDKVYTGDNGWVSIKFLDDSVARLKEESFITINKLFEDVDNQSITNVEVEITYGDMWTRVLNLFEDESYFMVTAGDMEASTKKAAFNVHMDEDVASVEVYSNVVQTKTMQKVESVKVKTGETAEVKAERVVVAKTGVEDDTWVQSNLESDKAHIAKVEEEVNEGLRDTVGTLPASTLYPFKSLKSGVVKFLTFDDVSRQKIDLDVSERKFVEWSVMMDDGDVGQDDAEEIFEEFVAEVESFKAVIENVRSNGDIQYADELKTYLQNKIGNVKNGLNNVLPTSPLYTAKEYLNFAEEASAEGDAEKAVIKKKQVASKLSEAQDLAEAGEEALAVQVLDDYVEETAAVNKEVDALSAEDAREVEEEIADVVEVEMDMIFSMEETSEELIVDIEVVTNPIITPVPQRTVEFGVSATGTGSDMKVLDPLLDLSR